jgi:hypothetical protein
MEAATPLHRPQVRTQGDRLVVDALVIDDPCAVRLAGEREAAGDDPARFVQDAVAIGARVLDREQAGAQADFVRAEFEKQAREVETAFGERAQRVGDDLAKQLETVFGAENGHLTKSLQKHFSDDSAGAVQHRVKAVVDEVTRKMRDDLLRQFSSADGQNPLADFKSASVGAIRQMGDRQDARLHALLEKLAGLEVQVERLHGEREKQLELVAEQERGTAKGRTYEEAVFAALDAIAVAQGDDADAVGDLKGATRKTGDIVVAIDGCRGASRGSIVFEAKDRRLSKPEAMRELERAKAERGADYAVLVVPCDDELPAKTQPLREHQGDKLFVSYDPEDGSRVALEVAYALARARVLMARGGGDGIDTAAVGDVAERALGALRDTQKVKLQLTGASSSIDTARQVLVAMEEQVKCHLAEIQELLAPAAPSDGD